MKVLTTAIVLKKLKKKTLSEDIRRRVLKVISFLQNQADENYIDLLEHLIKKNAKKLKGTTNNHIFKFRLDKANRLAFIYGKYLPNAREEYKDTLIILDCLKHDDQEDEDFTLEDSDYLNIDEISDLRNISSDIDITTMDDIQEMGIMDLDDTQIWNYYFEEQSMYVLNDNELFDADIETLDVCLSNEQDKYIQEYMKKQCPTLILGGAGTGKTLMTIHILHRFKDNRLDAKCLYLTQSKTLLRTAEDRYEVLSGLSQLIEEFKEDNIPNVEFANIADYCMKRLGVEHKNLVTYERFVTEFVEKREDLVAKLNKYHIHLFDLWAEIRGTIKGGLGDYWNRVECFNQQNLSIKQSVFKEFEKHHIITRKCGSEFEKNILGCLKKHYIHQKILWKNCLKKQKKHLSIYMTLQ